MGKLLWLEHLISFNHSSDACANRPDEDSQSLGESHISNHQLDSREPRQKNSHSNTSDVNNDQQLSPVDFDHSQMNDDNDDVAEIQNAFSLACEEQVADPEMAFQIEIKKEIKETDPFYTCSDVFEAAGSNSSPCIYEDYDLDQKPCLSNLLQLECDDKTTTSEQPIAVEMMDCSSYSSYSGINGGLDIGESDVILFGQGCCPYDDCLLVFSKIDELLEHVTSAHVLLETCTFECEKLDCQEMFDSAKDFLKHCWQQHFKVRKCVFCPQDFGTFPKRALQAHISKNHRFGCYQCGSADFTERKHLQRHIFNTHKKAKHEYYCGLCMKTTKSSERLLMHWREHVGIDKYQCPLCQLYFKCSDDLHTHLADHKKENSALACPACEKYETKNIRIFYHHWLNDCYRHKCQHCDYSGFTAAHLQQHIIRKHEPNKQIPCCVPMCKYKAVTRQAYEKHLFGIHQITANVSRANQLAVIREHPEHKIYQYDELKQYSCRSKDFQITDFHQAIDECKFPNCGHKASGKELERHVAKSHKKRKTSDPDGRYGLGKKFAKICHLCGTPCRDGHSKMRHLYGYRRCSIHCRCKWYSCKSCGKQYSQIMYLVNHWQNDTQCQPTAEQRTKYKPYFKRNQERLSRKCPLCSYATDMPSKIRRHLFFHFKKGDRIPPEFNFKFVKCPKCSHTACDESHLQRHLKTHPL